MDESTIKLLIKRAIQARENAYAPYSKFKVGAAVLNEDGEVYTGCNIENAAFSVTICAERTAIFKAISTGKKKFRAIAIVADTPTGVCMPCGSCRQVIAEFFDVRDVIICANIKGEYKEYTVAQILPGAFTPKDLSEDKEESKKSDIPTI